MPFIPIANQAIRSRLTKFQSNRSESSVDISWWRRQLLLLLQTDYRKLPSHSPWRRIRQGQKWTLSGASFFFFSFSNNVQHLFDSFPVFFNCLKTFFFEAKVFVPTNRSQRKTGSQIESNLRNLVTYIWNRACSKTSN